MPVALGLHSPILERARSLRTKAGRADAGRYLIEGPTLLAEALAAGLTPAAVYGTEAALAAAAPTLGDRVPDDHRFVLPERGLARLSELESPAGIVAELPIVLAEPAACFDGPPVAVLAGIGDPGNAGTLLRSAEIFGIGCAVFVAGSVEPHNPKVVRATMGALFRLRIAVASPEVCLAAARAAGYTIVAAEREGEPLPGFTFPSPVAIAIGGERRGVGGSLPHVDRAVAIPHRGDGESLNAAIAGSIVFYAFSLRPPLTVP